MHKTGGNESIADIMQETDDSVEFIDISQPSHNRSTNRHMAGPSDAAFVLMVVAIACAEVSAVIAYWVAC